MELLTTEFNRAHYSKERTYKLRISLPIIFTHTKININVILADDYEIRPGDPPDLSRTLGNPNS